MPISSQTPIIGYVANGVTKSFAFPFAILSADDLKVKVGADVVTTGFSIAGVGDRDGGSVTFTDAPASLTPIILYREVTLDRTTDYQENGDLLAIVLDDDLDRIWMALQDQLLLSDRALRSPLGETLQQLPPASERALMALAFDAAGNPIVVRGTNDGGAALALDLMDTAPGKGAALVGYDDGTAQAVLDESKPMANYTALRAYTGRATGVRITQTGLAGFFQRDDADTTSADNGGTIIVDASGRRWKRIFEGALNVHWFGAKGDWDGSTGTDDTDAIQATIAAAYYSAPQTGWRMHTRKIYAPRGRYRIAKPNTLFQGLVAGSYNIEGDGKHGITEFYYDVAAPLATDYLIKNDNLFGFVNFTGIKFTAPATANQNFMYYSSTGTAQGFTFTSCSIVGWENLFNVLGTANASENTFYDCRIIGFSGAGFKITNNTQAVNWRFFGVDIESFTGVLLDLLSGATFNFYQGSIIPTGAAARIVRVPVGADSNKFGAGNSPNALWHGTRFEMRNGALMTEKVVEAVKLRLVWEKCGMGGVNITDAAVNVLTWAGAGSLTFNSCQNMANYRFGYTVSGSSLNELRVKVVDCGVDARILTSSTFALTGATANVGVAPLFDVSGCGLALDGMYRVKDSQAQSAGGMHVASMSRAVSFSKEAGIVAAAVQGASATLALPPVRLREIAFYPTARGTYGTNTATITVTVVDSTDTLVTTLGSVTWQMNAPASVKLSIDLNYYLNALAGHKLKFTFTSTYTSGYMFFAGNLYLTY